MPDAMKLIIEDLLNAPWNLSRTAQIALFEAAAALIESLSAEMERVKRERDAAVEELSYSRQCSICKKHLSEGGDCYGNHKCGNGNPDWQWRGVKEET